MVRDAQSEARYQEVRDQLAQELEGTSSASSLPDGAIAWLTVAGTSIDYPVAEAWEENPNYYLSHDLWGGESRLGCPYLDWRCGKRARHNLIYAHHVGSTDLQFSPIADAWQQASFDTIGPATLTEKDGNTTYLPCLALRVDESYQGIQKFEFSDQPIDDWLSTLLEDAQATSPQAADLCKSARNALTLVTCSSELSGQRERTLLIFVEV